MVFGREQDHPSRWAAVVSIAEKIGYVPQTLHEWVKEAEVNSGKRVGVPTEVADKVKALEREVHVLPTAPFTYRECVAQRQYPTRRSARARHDVALKPEIARVFAENLAVYGVRKVWRQMIREGVPVARCTVRD